MAFGKYACSIKYSTEKYALCVVLGSKMAGRFDCRLVGNLLSYASVCGRYCELNAKMVYFLS